MLYGVNIMGVEVPMFWASTCLLAPPVPHCRGEVQGVSRSLREVSLYKKLPMRSVVSYDDLEQLTTTPTPVSPPAKKRKRQQNKTKPLGPQKFAHWDEPVEDHDASFAGHGYTDGLRDQTPDADSRELTHEEIWDDSALIEAWDAAMDEYKVCHILMRVQSLAHCI